jgi:hypothetical protein
MLPDTLGGLARDTWGARSGGSMGIAGSMAKAIVREKASKAGGGSEDQVILENCVIVQAEGSGVEFAVVERAVTGFDPKRPEGLAKAR